jgi:gamma-glutamyl-gamma-aminobutyrate hydrolase PuuD
VAATASHAAREIVEAVESLGHGQLILGVQCHPERTESTPPEFERLFAFFVDAARA